MDLNFDAIFIIIQATYRSLVFSLDQGNGDFLSVIQTCDPLIVGRGHHIFIIILIVSSVDILLTRFLLHYFFLFLCIRVLLNHQLIYGFEWHLWLCLGNQSLLLHSSKLFGLLINGRPGLILILSDGLRKSWLVTLRGVLLIEAKEFIDSVVSGFWTGLNTLAVHTGDLSVWGLNLNSLFERKRLAWWRCGQLAEWWRKEPLRWFACLIPSRWFCYPFLRPL